MNSCNVAASFGVLFVMSILASYATMCPSAPGRIHPDGGDRENAFLQDRERIVHSTAFRRLEYKTQVFVNHVGDHYRTRLTHSLEVAQVARNLARVLRLNEDLAEVLALGHDIGHPPFGHAGEDGLREAAEAFGGFDHNAHTLKIVTKIEQRHIGFDGLNLTIDSLDGLAKHNGPITSSNKKSHQNLFDIVKEIGLDPQKHPSLEAQVTALADDIAYINHDIDDGIRAGMFEIEELCEIPLINMMFKKLCTKYNTQPQHKVINELIRELVQLMMRDLVSQTQSMILNYHIETLHDVQNCSLDLVSFSEEIDIMKQTLKAFLMQRVYRNYKVNRMVLKSQHVIKSLYYHFTSHPECLPDNWYKKVRNTKKSDISEGVIDYIAGMTDRFAIEEYKKIFDPNFF